MTAQAKRQRYRVGDIFGIPLPQGLWALGRLVFDPWTQAFQSKLLSTDTSALYWHAKALLLDVYTGIHAAPVAVDTSLVIQGVWVHSASLAAGEWPIVGHVVVDPAEVEFPETMIGSGTKVVFKRGELQVSTKMSSRTEEELHCRPSNHNSHGFFRTLLHHLGRRDLLDHPNGSYDLASDDLRFHPRRADIYAKYLELDPDAPYYPTALAHGFDLARFYP